MPTALRQVIDAAVAELGGLSILYNNAGTSTFNRLHEMDPAEWDRVLRVNLTGVFAGFQAAVPHLLAGRRWVHRQHGVHQRDPAGRRRGSLCGQQGRGGRADRSAALEYAPTIRVNAVSPGMIRTAMTAPMFEFLPEPGRALRDGHAGGPRRRARGHRRCGGVPLLGPGPVRHGQNIVVDGGLTLHGSGVDGIFELVFGGRQP